MPIQYPVRSVPATHLTLGFVVFHNIKFLAALKDIKSGVAFTSNKFVDYRKSVYVFVYLKNSKTEIRRKYNVDIVNIKKQSVTNLSDNTFVGVLSAIMTKFLKGERLLSIPILKQTTAVVYELRCHDPLDHHRAHPKKVLACLSNLHIWKDDDYSKKNPTLHFIEGAHNTPSRY